MTFKLIIAAGALLASTSAFAQAPGTEQTTEDLVCQLSEKCAEEGATPADEAASAAPTDKSAPRVSATRGFKIARKVDGPSAATATGTSGQRLAKPAVKSSASPVKRAQVAASGDSEKLGLAVQTLTPEIAENLGISVRTAENHVARLRGKLGVDSRGSLIRLALRHGLTDP